jgi:predicted PurR-regulated permease PerM
VSCFLSVQKIWFPHKSIKYHASYNEVGIVFNNLFTDDNKDILSPYSPFMNLLNPTQLKQYLFVALIIGLVWLLGTQLFNYFPGVLGAITFYILLRQWYFNLTVIRGWKKWTTAVLFLTGSLLVFVLPFIGIALMLAPKAGYLMHNTAQLTASLTQVFGKLQQHIPGFKLGNEQLKSLAEKGSAILPAFLGSTLNTFTNLVLCFFLLYFMLVDGRRLERRVQEFLPLKDENVNGIWQATRNMVFSNAIGIPMLAVVQALVAAVGFKLFGIPNFMVWAVLTGIFSIIPIIGTAVICGPLAVYLMATGKVAPGIGLGIYSLAVIGTMDNVLRFTILKKLGDVHPVITVFGILVGVPIFGFMGFIFGPLLVSYLLLLLKIYDVEFSPKHRETHPEP